ncbi:MAG: hypothetical protein K6B75_02265 [Lachnospiraceae bacterium]|nr:hypothetical protein [Lachnospiraceae bacterium]
MPFKNKKTAESLLKSRVKGLSYNITRDYIMNNGVPLIENRSNEHAIQDRSVE